MRDPYAILGVSRSADQVEIKAAWRDMAKKLHPDQNRSDPNAHSRFTEVGRAYDLLKDPDKRRRYDEMLNRSSFSGGASNSSGTGNGGGFGNGGASSKASKDQTFMERRVEKARMEAEARARAEAEARMREEAEARAKMKAQAEARAKADAAAATAGDDSAASGAASAAIDDEVTPEQHEQFFEKLFGSRRQAGSSGDVPGDGRRRSDRASTEDATEARSAEPPGEETAPEEREPAGEEAAFTVPPQPETEPQQTEPGGSPARGLLSYLVRRLTGQASAPEKAPEFRVDANVTIEDLLGRINPTVYAPDGKLLTVPLPEDAMEGTTIRLEGYGYKLPGMKRGDVIATIRIRPHKWYRADHYDLRTFHDIDIENAVLGCETNVETPDGPVRITVPAWSGSSKTIKVEGKGLPRGSGRRGNLIVEIRVMLWDHPDQKVVDLMRSLREGLYL